METYFKEECFNQLYDNPDLHGPIWVIIIKALQYFVTIFALLGILRFKLHFVDRDKLYRGISYAFITYNSYIFLKFTLIAFTTYLFNLQVNSESSILYKFNCSFNHNLDFPTYLSDLKRPEFIRFTPYAKSNSQQSFEGTFSIKNLNFRTK